MYHSNFSTDYHNNNPHISSNPSSNTQISNNNILPNYSGSTFSQYYYIQKNTTAAVPATNIPSHQTTSVHHAFNPSLDTFNISYANGNQFFDQQEYNHYSQFNESFTLDQNNYYSYNSYQQSSNIPNYNQHHIPTQFTSYQPTYSENQQLNPITLHTPLYNNNAFLEEKTNKFLLSNSNSSSKKKRKLGETEESEENPEPSHEKQPVKKRIAFLPRIFKRDFRRLYAKIFANVYNSCDYNFILSYFSNFFTNDFKFCLKINGTKSFKTHEMKDRLKIAKFWFDRMHDSPDYIFTVGSTQIKVRTDNTAVLKFQYNVTGKKYPGLVLIGKLMKKKKLKKEYLSFLNKSNKENENLKVKEEEESKDENKKNHIYEIHSDSDANKPAQAENFSFIESTSYAEAKVSDEFMSDYPFINQEVPIEARWIPSTETITKNSESRWVIPEVLDVLDKIDCDIPLSPYIFDGTIFLHLDNESKIHTIELDIAHSQV